MKALRIPSHGGTDVLTLVEEGRPLPKKGEVLVRVHAVSLNHLDVWVRKGVEGHHFPLPLIPSSDCSGIIEEVGPGVQDWEAGDEVVVAPAASCGACEACRNGRDNQCRSYHIRGESMDGVAAEYIAVSTRYVFRKPANLSHAQAAASLLAPLTAWHMLMGRAKLTRGESVLIHAGASGVGSAAIQIAKMAGAKVFATAGTDQKVELALKLGADEACNYATESFPSKVRQWSEKRGVDVVFEHVGKATWDQSLRCLAWGGRLVTCGATTGHDVNIDLRRLFFKGWSILGSSMGTLGEFEAMLREYENGTLIPVVDRVLPGAAIATAHELIEQRGLLGKVVLDMTQLSEEQTS